MATCNECEALRGKLSDVEPHAALARIARNKHRAYGMATGAVEIYQCSDCGAELSRDCDPKDPGANWAISKAGK